LENKKTKQQDLIFFFVFQYYSLSELGIKTAEDDRYLCGNTSIKKTLSNFLFFPISLNNVGLKFKYQFNEEILEAESKKSNTENGSASKKMKLTNDKRKNTIFCYSSVQLPLAAFIDYIEKEYLNNFVNHCMESQQSKK